MEEALKAGHCIEPVKGMQFCAAAVDTEDNSAAKRAVDVNTAISFLLPE